jgi:hypothetical protein
MPWMNGRGKAWGGKDLSAEVRGGVEKIILASVKRHQNLRL